MKLFYLLFLIIGAPAIADTQSCPSGVRLPDIEPTFFQLSEELSELEWWAATDEQIEASPCADEAVPNLAGMKTFLAKGSGSKVKENVFGLELEDSAENIKLLKRLLTVDNNPGNAIYGHISQPNYKAPDGCVKVACAAGSIFGKSSTKILFSLKKYGLNMSHLRFKKSRAWTEEEIDFNLQAVNDLPMTMLPIEENHNFLRHKTFDSGNRLANASIFLFDLWEEESAARKRYTIVHELGHNVGQALDLTDDPKWLELSGWKGEFLNYDLPGDKELVSDYSKENPNEDFAETFAAYRYNPEGLKELAPKKYEFMKKYVFLGLEYTSEDSCKESNSLLSKLPYKEPGSLEFCANEFVPIMNGKGQREKMRNCLAKGARKKAADSLSALEGGDPLMARSLSVLGGQYELERFTPSEEQVDQGFEKIKNELKVSLMKNYSNFSTPGNCEELRKSGYWNFSDGLKALFGDDDLAYKSKNELNEIVIKTCELYPNKYKLEGNEKGIDEIFESVMGITP